LSVTPIRHSAGPLFIGDGIARVQIHDGSEGTAGRVQFRDAEVASVERQTDIDVYVERVGNFDGAIKVDYYTLDGTATAPQDYSGIPWDFPATLSWGDGDNGAKIITIPLSAINDLGEIDETFFIVLTNPRRTDGSPSDNDRGVNFYSNKRPAPFLKQ